MKTFPVLRRLQRGVVGMLALAMLVGGLTPFAAGVANAQDGNTFTIEKQKPHRNIYPQAIATPGQTAFALVTDAGLGARQQRLVTFDINSPGTVRSDVAVSGLQANERLVGIDFRPATGQLYGLGSRSNLYLINVDTAALTQVGTTFTPTLDPSNFYGFDFNPVPDRIRVVANVTNQNFRINPNTGAGVDTDTTTAGTQGDPNVAYDAADPNAGNDPNLVGAAYTNNDNDTATSTTNYALDARPTGGIVRLVTQGTAEGVTPAVSPNTGRLFTVGNVRIGQATVESNNLVGFDIPQGNNTGYAALTPINPFNAGSSLYSINLTSGEAVNLGQVGNGLRVEGFAIAVAARTTAASTVQFSSAGYSVAEGAGSITITITRTATTGGNLDQPVTVDFQTDDSGAQIRCDVVSGTAFERCDYSSEFARINFAPGEASRTVTVFIMDDGFAEGSEVFNVSLRGASDNVQLGTVSRATVSITDNETTNSTTNPIDTPEFFVRQLYIDFLNREPDQAGFDAFVAKIRTCPSGDTTCDRIAVASAFSRSDEYLLNKGYFSYRFYRAALGRRQTYQEFVRDLDRLTVATGPEVEPRRAQFAVEFTQREEFRARYGNLNNQQFVQQLYATAGVTLALNEPQQIIGQLDRGEITRAQVLRNLVERMDFFNREFNAGYVLAQYFGFLRRDPDEQGFQNFLAIANQNSTSGGLVTPAGSRIVVANFVNSTEYRLRFGNPAFPTP